jgi:hypothetical protein
VYISKSTIPMQIISLMLAALPSESAFSSKYFSLSPYHGVNHSSLTYPKSIKKMIVNGHLIW